jgi:hypothetical protein
MMRRKDYLPGKEKDLLVWMLNFLAKVMLFLSKWKVPATEADDMNDKIGRFKAAKEVVDDKAHTQQDVDKKNMVKKEAIGSVRLFVNYHINGNPNVTLDQRKVCGLTVPDNDPTLSPDPTSTPVKKRVDHPTEGQVRIWIEDSITGLSVKPDGVHGWEARLKVCAERILHRDQLDRSEFVTHNPLVLQFDDYQLGMIISITFRYENTRGVKGPWSEIYYIIIS